MNIEKITKIFQSKWFKYAIIVVIALIVILISFKAGSMVGFRRADFSCRWGDNYHKNFGGPKGGFFGGMDDRGFVPGNGIFGQIIKIEGNVLTVKGQDNIEKSILLDNNTSIVRMKEAIKISDLKVDDSIVVVGEPNEAGQTVARLVRVMPALPTGMPMSPQPQKSI